jgi:NADPH2:quinone reductase
MKAIDFKKFGDASVLELVDVPDPVLRPRDLLVRNRAVGVNRADLLTRNGHYGRADFGDSVLMGLEIAGEVTAVGAEVRGFKIGDRVMGIVGGGGYAEISRIDERMAMPIPEGLDDVHAAAIPEVFVTAHEALFHLGHLEQGQSVLSHASAGGVGSAAVQLAHASGAQVFATTKAEKIERVRELGANVVIDYKTQNFAEIVAQTTQNQGVHVVVDFIGGPYFDQNINSLTEGGRLIQVGLLGGSKANIALDKLLYKRLQIIGTVMKSRTPEEKQAMTARFRDQWLTHFRADGLTPVIDQTFPLAQASDAHRRMESGANIGKIILLP